MTLAELDRSSPIPLYYQLAEQVRELIRQGSLNTGDRVWSDRELSEQLRISRMTARQAIAYLVREGELLTKPGLGTFVAAPKRAYDALHLVGFTEELMRQGIAATSHVLEQTQIMPSPHVARRLQLDASSGAVRIVRLRLGGDLPLLLETTVVPSHLCPGLERQDLSAHSLYTLMEQQYGLELRYAQQSLEATIANDYERRLFGVDFGTPMLLLEGVTYLADGSPVEYFKAIYRGDRFKFELESHRGTSAVTQNIPRVSVSFA